MRIELYEGFFVKPELIAVVKATGENTCALFTPGQSAVDEGFYVPYSAADVNEQLDDAEEEEDYEEENGDEEDEEDEEEEEPKP